MRRSTVDENSVVEKSRRLCKRDRSCWMRDEGGGFGDGIFDGDLFERKKFEGEIERGKRYIYDKPIRVSHH